MDINKKELVETLTKGRDSAKKLQNLLSQKVDDDGSASVGDLVTEISQSFYGSLLVLNSPNSGEFSRVPVSSPCSGDQIQTPAKGRRGCYKRRYLKLKFYLWRYGDQTLTTHDLLWQDVLGWRTDVHHFFLFKTFIAHVELVDVFCNLFDSTQDLSWLIQGFVGRP